MERRKFWRIFLSHFVVHHLVLVYIKLIWGFINLRINRSWSRVIVFCHWKFYPRAPFLQFVDGRFFYCRDLIYTWTTNNFFFFYFEKIQPSQICLENLPLRSNLNDNTFFISSNIFIGPLSILILGGKGFGVYTGFMYILD